MWTFIPSISKTVFRGDFTSRKPTVIKMLFTASWCCVIKLNFVQSNSHGFCQMTYSMPFIWRGTWIIPPVFSSLILKYLDKFLRCVKLLLWWSGKCLRTLHRDFYHSHAFIPLKVILSIWKEAKWNISKQLGLGAISLGLHSSKSRIKFHLHFFCPV